MARLESGEGYYTSTRTYGSVPTNSRQEEARECFRSCYSGIRHGWRRLEEAIRACGDVSCSLVLPGRPSWMRDGFGEDRTRS